MCSKYVDMNSGELPIKRIKMGFHVEEPEHLQATDECFKEMINQLPDEVLEYILSFISPYKELKECQLVCKRWYRIVMNVIRMKQYELTKAITAMDVAWKTVTPVEMAPTITKRYSHSACYHDNSMYVFGGCTSTSTTFNDLWRLDLNKRQWVRPLTMGTYPSPKACSTMVYFKDSLILFGGWTHPSPYPLHQASRLFNELHVYSIISNRWMCISTTHPLPAMAGHSASVHGNTMVVFGGLKKNLQGDYTSSSDVWCLNLDTYEWRKQKTSVVKPPNRYGQSQIALNEHFLLIIGGCGGPNRMFSDVWLLDMVGEVWQWREVTVRNPQWSALHMWCHPACKVGDQVVMMSRHPKASRPYMPYNMPYCNRVWVPPRANERDTSIPLRDGNGEPTPRLPDVDNNVNGQRGRFRLPPSTVSYSPNVAAYYFSKYGYVMPGKNSNDNNTSGSSDSDSQPSTSGMSNQPGLSSSTNTVSVNGSNNGSSSDASCSSTSNTNGSSPSSSSSNSSNLSKSSIGTNATSTVTVSTITTSTSTSPSSGSGTRHTEHRIGSSPRNDRRPDHSNERLSEAEQVASGGSRVSNLEMAAFREQSARTCPTRARERQLQALQRFENRIRYIDHCRALEAAENGLVAAPVRIHRAMALYVMDISQVLTDECFVSWLEVHPEEPGRVGPEETILYTLVVGRGELIMFGGIQKDANTVTTQVQPSSTNSVSNSLHFISAPRDII